jgi:HEAT repeat protein
LAHHFDRKIRLAAVQGIVFCEGSDDEKGAQPISDVLLSLMEDEDDEIRDWATTGLARQLDDDSRVIRAALWKRMSDPAPGVRCEAIVGLARRHAPHVVERVREGLLDDPVDERILQAASFLADPELFPLLESVATRGVTLTALDAALSQCSRHSGSNR